MSGNERVDVLIIGSGASGAAVAWSLAETKMRILCLEQGDWMKSTDFPSQRPRLGGAALHRFRHQPEPPRARHRLSGQRRQLADEGRQLQRRRRRHGDLHGALAAHASVGLQGEVARWRGRRLADRLLGAGALLRRERPHDGRLGPGRRSRRAAAPSADAADPARQDRHALRPGDEQARLALVALRHHHRHDRLTRAARSASTSATARRAAPRAPRPAPTSPTGRSPSAPASSCARAAGCARSPPTSTAWRPARSTTTPTGKEHFQPAEVVIVACNGVGTPRLLLNSASARFPNGLANSSGLVGRNLMLHPWPMISGYVEETLDGGRGAHHHAVEQAVLRDRSPRAASCAATRCSSTAAPARRTRRSPAPRPGSCRGGATIIASTARCSTIGWGSASPATTCPRSTIASRSIRC